MLINEEITSGDVASTTSADIANKPEYMFGKPLFKVSNDLFYKIGFTNRNQHGWFQKFYGTEVGEWAKSNKGKKFLVKHEEQDLFIDCEVK